MKLYRFYIQLFVLVTLSLSTFENLTFANHFPPKEFFEVFKNCFNSALKSSLERSLTDDYEGNATHWKDSYSAFAQELKESWKSPPTPDQKTDAPGSDIAAFNAAVASLPIEFPKKSVRRTLSDDQQDILDFFEIYATFDPVKMDRLTKSAEYKSRRARGDSFNCQMPNSKEALTQSYSYTDVSSSFDQTPLKLDAARMKLKIMQNLRSLNPEVRKTLTIPTIERLNQTPGLMILLAKAEKRTLGKIPYGVLNKKETKTPTSEEKDFLKALIHGDSILQRGRFILESESDLDPLRSALEPMDVYQLCSKNHTMSSPDCANSIIPHGLYSFVIDSFENIIIDQETHKKAGISLYTDAQGDHSNLGLFLPVIFAGEILFIDGKIASWNNRSGSYMCDAAIADRATPYLPPDLFVPYVNGSDF
jgi:hypothetical protein